MRKNVNLLTSLLVIGTESPASWLARTCQLHCFSFNFIFQALRLTPPKDADIVAYDKLFRRFAYSSNMPPSHLSGISKWFEPLVSSGKSGQAVHKEINKSPYTHFCPHCLSKDKIPHWRPQWRLKFWQVCPEHQCKMVDECPECGEHQHTNKINLKLDSDATERALQYCVHCSADLTEAISAPLMDSATHDKIIAQDYLLKICREGKYSINPQSHHPDNEQAPENPSYPLTDTQRLIVDFHMAYLECNDKTRNFYGFKHAIKKKSYLENHV
jgi:hypothetical protein